MTKQEMLDQLQGPGSVDYTFMPIRKVIEMLEQLEDTPSTSLSCLTEDEMREIASLINDNIKDEGMDLISDYDLTMNGREVELDNLTLDDYLIEKIALSSIRDFFDERVA